jgi:uncharacterized protein YkwD
MKKIWTIALLMVLASSSCIKIAQEPVTEPPPPFVTSTLPPTKSGLALPTATLPTSTPDASTTTTPGTPLPEGTASTSTTGACKDSAAMISDVTVPDNSVMSRGQSFTKTWRFMNNGKCNWNGYTIAFYAGDRMSSPDTAPVPATAAGQTVDVSVQLTAPSSDGAYTGYYVLKNDKGEVLPIGIEQSFWLKILIGNVAAAPVSTLTTSGTPVATPKGPGGCNYSTSSAYVNELATLINNARAQAGLPQLSMNAQLTAAAQGHSIDLACHNLLSHTGSDGSSVHDRIAAAGYYPSRSSEIIYGSGFPQTAFDWWMNDQVHRDEILSPYTTEMGIGYAYKADTSYGSYFTVDFASP